MRYISLAIMAAVFSLTVVYNACQPQHFDPLGGSANLSSNAQAKCLPLLKAAFPSYHGFLVNNCAVCHARGGSGNGSFADADIDHAFGIFEAKTESKIAQFATSTHQTGFTGPQLETELTPIRQTWSSANVEYQACVASLSTPGDGDGDGLDLSGPRIVTTSKTMNATENYQTMSWDLGSEVASGGQTFAGAQVEIEVRLVSVGDGDTTYTFRNPVIQAGGNAIHVASLLFEVNGLPIAGGTTWSEVDRRVPANQTRNFSEGGGALTFNTTATATDVLAISIGAIEEITFDPPTYTQLAQQVFSVSCNACHSGANPDAGYDTSDYTSLLNQVVKFSPEFSHLHQRMTDAGAPMPQSGLLGLAQQNMVRDWILDGAPNN